MLDAGKVFDGRADDFYLAMGTPKCAESFRKKYIVPAGDVVDAEFGYLIGRYQREGFVTGFRAAVQLLMGCMTGDATKE